jgi:hypothetical protein
MLCISLFPLFLLSSSNTYTARPGAPSPELRPFWRDYKSSFEPRVWEATKATDGEGVLKEWFLKDWECSNWPFEGEDLLITRSQNKVRLLII